MALLEPSSSCASLSICTAFLALVRAIKPTFVAGAQRRNQERLKDIKLC
jgi:hypothetical protein